MQVLKTELHTDLQEISQRSLRMEAQLQDAHRAFAAGVGLMRRVFSFCCSK
jgi:hypothetical protein